MLHRPLYRRKAGYSFIRSLNPAAWFRADTGVTVTGLGASTWADQSGNGRDLLQTTDASRPPYLSYAGTKYLYLPGVSGNTATTPSAGANQVTGDIDIRCFVAASDWTPSGYQVFVDKWQTAGQRAYQFYLTLTTGVLGFASSVDGTATTVSVSSTAAPAVSDGAALWVRVTRHSASGDVKFYTSSDGSTWTQLGATVSAAAGAIFAGTSVVTVGGQGGASLLAGNVYRAIIKNGIDGTTVVDFNPDLDGSDQAATITSSATGEVWTINTSGGLPAQIVASPRLLGDGTADAMATANFTLNQATSGLMVVRAVSWTSGDYLCSGTVAEAGLTQVTSTPQVGLNAGSAAAANSGITLGSWKIVYYEINGASSKIKVGSAAATTGNAGANNPGGLALFRNQAATAFGNAMLREWIVFSAALDDAAIARVMNYASGRWGVAL